MFKNFILGFAVICGVSACVNKIPEGQQPMQESVCPPKSKVLKELKDTVATMVADFVRREDFKGSMLIAYQGEIIFKDSYGKANIESLTDNTTDTRFLIASMTKQFTAMCILILQEEGKLTVSDTIDTYLPELKGSDTVTIHHLLTHTSGFPAVLPGSWDNDYIRDYPGSTNREKLVNAAKSGDLGIYSTPGTRFNYSDLNYMILGHIVEQESGIPFEDFLKSRIFVPLEMVNTGTGYYPSSGSRHAYGYGQNGSMLVEGLTCAEMGCGSGSMYSTVEDLFKWDRALYTEKLVTASSLQQMFTRYNDIYGYGWWFMDTDKGNIPIHGGRILNGSFSGFYIRDSVDDVCLIILGNDGRHDEKRDFLFTIHASIKKIVFKGTSKS